MKKLLLLLLLLITSPVIAGETTLTWVAPTKYESCVDSGTITDLAGFKIYQLIADLPDPLITEFVISELLPGTYEYTSLVYTTGGSISRLSNPTEKIISTFETINTTVFTVQKFKNKFLLLPVGTVALGLTCIKEETINGHYAIAREAVTWTGTIEPQVVVAKCG